ncbi:MAG: periplasmic sensor signal transduction histidine kinase [Caulobacter sp.]|nr:periplasmic sensor signal transduction histidine kinase [Caulobacter sp.]
MILRRYFGSMAGRLFVFLLIGVIGSAILALAMADARRVSDLRHIRQERLADRMGDVLSLLDNASKPLRDELLTKGVPGIHRASGLETIVGTDSRLARALSPRFKTLVEARQATPQSCSPVSPSHDQFDCWVITVKLRDGETVHLQVRGRREIGGSYGMDPLFLIILGVGTAALAFFSARMAAAPLRDLSRAARALGGDLDRLPLPERGPNEVREAAEAFNAMQTKLRDYVVERTQMLASITHDLQTPMTRLRLRLEKVVDPALRSRLIDDLAVMQVLIREGLDYARSNQTDEPFARLALDDLLEIVIEDAAEGGKSVTLAQRCGSDVEARPRALQRCLANLIDNALKYGGSAEVSAEWTEGEVRIRIRDHGPGIPAEMLDQAVKPFVRLDAALTPTIDGVGLGLTIAKMLAEKNDAELVLGNHAEGGLEACVILRRGISKTPIAPSPVPAKRRRTSRAPAAVSGVS